MKETVEQLPPNNWQKIHDISHWQMKETVEQLPPINWQKVHDISHWQMKETVEQLTENTWYLPLRNERNGRTTDRKYMISPTDKWKKRSNNSHRTTDRKYIIFATNEMEDTIRQHLHSHRNKISDKRQLTIAGQLRKLPLNKWSKRYGNSDKKASKNFEVREHSPKCNYSYSPFNYNPSEHVI